MKAWMHVFGMSWALVISGAGAAEHEKGPCAEQVKALCADVEKGGGRIIDCLKQHEAQLTGACKVQVSERANLREQAQARHAEHKGELKELRKELRAVCAEDVKGKCSDVAPGEGRILRCLQENEATLSAGCKTELAKLKGAREENKKEMEAIRQKRKSLRKGGESGSESPVVPR